MTNKDYITLHGRHSTLILERSDGSPLWRYWGRRLPQGVCPPALLRAERPTPTFTAASETFLTLLPTFGGGWFGPSALRAHRAGRAWSFVARQVVVTQSDNGVVCEITDEAAGLNAEVTLALDPFSDVITISTRLRNIGADAVSVDLLAAGTLPVPPTASRVISYSGWHQAEFTQVETPLSRAGFRRENRRGLTSHDCPPSVLVECTDGAFIAAHLAWSGNSSISVEWGDDGRFCLQSGAALAPGEGMLAPGQTLTSPDLMAVYAEDGRNAAMQSFHDAMRKRLAWPGGQMGPRPVQLNTWEGFYFAHDEQRMMTQATLAAAIGVERFVLDDGWFLRRHNDQTSLGDWVPDPQKYPSGLGPLAAHVTELGMEFGLWLEPEMVSPDSDLYRQHPEWVLRPEHGDPVTSRHQLMLDMSNPEVGTHLFDAINKLLRTLPISYLKWDHNRDMDAWGDVAPYRRQVEGTYALLHRLRTHFPNVEIESCAAGGGRIDAGILQYVHRFWASDNLDAVSRQSIQRGFLQFFPPEVMGAHVGAAPAHGTGRTQSLAFRIATAMQGHFGIELDITALADDERRTLARGIEVYKELRDDLHRGQVWNGTSADGILWQAYGDHREVILFLTREVPYTQRLAPSLTLPMLADDALYHVQRVWGAGRGGAPLLDDLANEGVLVAGAWARNHGLPVPPMGGEDTGIYRIRSV